MRDPTGTPPEQRWEPLSLEEVKKLLGPVSAPWWIAGGYALDLFLGHETRKHVGTDIAILRQGQKELLEALRKWDVHIAHNGELIPLKPGEAVTKPEHHQLWARETRDGPWRMEVFLEQSDGKRWAYRRNERIGLNVADLGRTGANDISFIRPEVMLLYKSKNPRPVDETDFLYALPRLDVAQKGWLSGALYTIDPTHRWIERLK
ncbi:MAG: nucleotidyltransferase domain-containing protein [Gammaproteobacteria bacterium]